MSRPEAPALHPTLAPLAQRWATFLDKVRARVVEIANEADAAYTEVISVDVVDGIAMGNVSRAIKARLLALRQKIDESWSKIDSEIDNVNGVETKVVARFRSEQCAIGRRFGRELEGSTEEIIVPGEASAARALAQLADKERAVAITCPHCGAPVARPPGPFYQTVNTTCGSCRAVVSATPGSASMMLVRGFGAIALAREAALPQWHALQAAEVAWHKLRKKTLDDLARFDAANRTYWQSYAEAMAQVVGWTPQEIADEVRGKMSQFVEYTAKDDRVVRENFGAGLAAIASNDPARVQQWLGMQRDRSGMAEELLEAIVERGWNDHASWFAQIAGLDAETVTDCFYYLSTRGD
jgi:hypothetical protein